MHPELKWLYAESPVRREPKENIEREVQNASGAAKDSGPPKIHLSGKQTGSYLEWNLSAQQGFIALVANGARLRGSAILFEVVNINWAAQYTGGFVTSLCPKGGSAGGAGFEFRMFPPYAIVPMINGVQTQSSVSFCTNPRTDTTRQGPGEIWFGFNCEVTGGGYNGIVGGAVLRIYTVYP